MSESGKSPAGAGPFDVYLGQRIRLRRNLMGLSQEKLGEALGLTFQQVQKYERGANRVSASRLSDMARVMNVPITFFYDGAPGEVGTAENVSRSTMGFAEAASSFGGPPARRSETPLDEAGLFTRRETIELVRAYYRIPDEGIRKRMADLIKSMGSSDES
ncbi:transcriptional regulator [Neoasaia chiangmaiensis NBRC 101099]|uniref:Transcriptional regulator n=1 Tax=Neoasaia chiangmaiensis TaxID=320497 RepID=A0A1U9KPW1_9PROT|nr:helix-turn-helix transcriptional regulator [Neoasaia chiangmaiensis]AQS87844.1 transcriptional regulator [Neoasaia chiangmaiensis]GBR35889.1 transcriptional regulator [Neoasaia chiangmaiensis NBRC 101099]GEN14463.1 hypothetical protein NCH01_08940 [Neoasaia chiangmaiensis]